MKAIIPILVLLAMFTSCKKETIEDKVKKEFETNYVNENFNDPADFIEVVKVENTNTLSIDMFKKRIIDSLHEIDSLKNALGGIEYDGARMPEKDSIEFFSMKNVVFYNFTLKVRQIENNEKKLVDYYAIADSLCECIGIGRDELQSGMNFNHEQINRCTRLLTEYTDILNDEFKFYFEKEQEAEGM